MNAYTLYMHVLSVCIKQKRLFPEISRHSTKNDYSKIRSVKIQEHVYYNTKIGSLLQVFRILELIIQKRAESFSTKKKK